MSGREQSQQGAMEPILFVDKVFLSPVDGAPCGVEVFNLNLLKDLCALGYPMTVFAHGTWADIVGKWGGGIPAEVIRLPMGSRDVTGCLLASLAVARRRFAVLLLGNVGNRLIPAMAMLGLMGAARRAVLIAHREPMPRFVRALRRMPTAVLAVNQKIAGHFEGMGFAAVKVSYGITDAARFHPPAGGKPDDGLVHFCVLGHLDRKWKGADTAIAAFRQLPEALRRRCRLHLAAYDRPPAFSEPEIIAYPWLPFEQMGDFLREMDVMLVPSRDEEVMRETFSQAVVQGMLTRLPAIVSALPVLTEKVDEGGGLVFRDVPECAQAMERLASDPAHRAEMGAKARRTALARYVWNTRAFAEEFLFPGTGSGEPRSLQGGHS